MMEIFSMIKRRREKRIIKGANLKILSLLRQLRYGFLI